MGRPPTSNLGRLPSPPWVSAPEISSSYLTEYNYKLIAKESTLEGARYN